MSTLYWDEIVKFVWVVGFISERMCQMPSSFTMYRDWNVRYVWSLPNIEMGVSDLYIGIGVSDTNAVSLILGLECQMRIVSAKYRNWSVQCVWFSLNIGAGEIDTYGVDYVSGLECQMRCVSTLY